MVALCRYSHCRMPTPARKLAVSLRVGVGDLRRARHLAARIGVGDSEIIRFAIKFMLAKFAPLCDPNIRGERLLPTFAQEDARELLRHFEIDSTELNAILNDGADEQFQVGMEEIQSIAVHGMHMPSADHSNASRRSG